MRNKLLGLAGAIGIALMPMMAAAQDITFATEAAYPPFNFRAADGSIAGFEIDLGNALCKKMNRNCTFVAQNWDGMIPGLLVKKFDGIFASMTITEERKKQIDFTDPYYQTAAVFVAAEATKIDFADKALGGLKIGTIPGVAQCYLEKAYPNASVQVYQNAEDMFLDVGAGRLDAVFSDRIQLDFGLLKTERGKGFAFKGDPVNEPGCFGEGIGIGLRKQDTDLREALNKAIKAVRDDGTYKAINDKYFSYDIFGK
ncbi:transporter substrate-binding domain-containing protein [Mesorhizobium sp. INR15]|uniref:transporter substrate-binding domain-containing protein n=1 Tax=Mesorhizobium sp. INR15 TaxID=2654248 RepID=UPI00189691CF|nr:transporter substrate-binding domain-containing protein [Mesorhizobium sp. INR15]QPC94504.1 transporter substrate-binding domain-containing protein [Mesorhizobium sp. INR15]